MNKALAVLSSLGIGAGLTYLVDPERGKRRRARLRDKAVRLRRVSRDGLDVARRDLGNRTMGWVSTTSARLRGEAVDDAVLLGRVRAKLGRHCSHAHAVEVDVREGTVHLKGAILAAEAGGLLDAIRRVPGVLAIEDRLDRHAQADIPVLTGGTELTSDELHARRQYWSPAYRLMMGIAGGGMVLWGVARRGGIGAGLGVAGLGLLSRAIANQDLRGLMGLTGPGITLQKTLTVNAPVDQVFAFWSRPENFPRFMRHIREVRNLGHGRSHWVVSGPAGIPVEWEAETTRTEPNALICWQSVPGATVSHTGTIRLQPNADGSTRLHIQMSYQPPAGVLGHAVATLFGADPKHEMDDDLARMKLLIQREALVSPKGRAQAPEKGLSGSQGGRLPAQVPAR